MAEQAPGAPRAVKGLELHIHVHSAPPLNPAPPPAITWVPCMVPMTVTPYTVPPLMPPAFYAGEPLKQGVPGAEAIKPEPPPPAA